MGSGISRILNAYGENCFKFTDNFIKITFPVSVQADNADHASNHASNHASVQAKLLIIILEEKEMSVGEILKVYKLVYKQVYKSHWYFKKHFIVPAIQENLVEMTYPNIPNHTNQKYRLTPKGIELKEVLKKQNENK